MKTRFAFCAETRRLPRLTMFENMNTSVQKRCFVCDKVDDHWTAKCPSLQCTICGETYTKHTANDCPILSKSAKSSVDNSLGQNSAKSLEVTDNPNSAGIQNLTYIHEDLKLLQQKLQNASQMENILIELNCGQNPNYLKTIRNIGSY